MHVILLFIHTLRQELDHTVDTLGGVTQDMRFLFDFHPFGFKSFLSVSLLLNLSD